MPAGGVTSPAKTACPDPDTDWPNADAESVRAATTLKRARAVGDCCRSIANVSTLEGTIDAGPAGRHGGTTTRENSAARSCARSSIDRRIAAKASFRELYTKVIIRWFRPADSRDERPPLVARRCSRVSCLDTCSSVARCLPS